MHSLKQLCVPRPSVFDTQRRDTVLDIADLVRGRIKPADFFEENYVTEGMKTLLEQAFRRLEGKSDQGVFKLKQAMGGGKTHNLVTLGLLAQHPEYRQKVMGSFYTPDGALEAVQVVAFSGRESDAPFGIWGSIAEQLGKKSHFKDLYAPLQAPGQTAWETLLENQTVLILLDELPPYFENARAKTIGNSDLARVTATALSNLLVAIGRPSCKNVCLVITDLSAAYQSGSQQISEILADLEKETHRTAMSLEPVRMNSDELYAILRKRLFEQLPTPDQIKPIAQAYAEALKNAKQMDITSESPEQFITHLYASYPFHPGIRDLYARFRENPGFQQTRGLIRLMRIVVSRLWSPGPGGATPLAEKRLLIAPHDLDFNDRETRVEISQVNNSLDNAIAHDIADEGRAVAEVMDNNRGGADTRDACRLLLMASLANVPHAVLGLSISELIGYLAEPERDVTRLRQEVLEKLSTAAWYLHADRDGRLYFKNVQNLNAKLESLVGAYSSEQAIKELRLRLEELFKPSTSWCYQRALALPAYDEIELEQERISLVITEPWGGPGLRQELRKFYDDTTWKNRVAFLTGPKNTYDTLIDTGKRLKAIKSILDELEKDKLPSGDPQMVQAQDLSDKIQANFHSAVRETFTLLWYPLEMNGKADLYSAEFSMKFEGNKYDGEQQILNLLKEKGKFEENITGDVFRKKCEQRLFTAPVLSWSEIKRRAAINPKWQWHIPRALDDLRADCLMKDIWREQGGYVDKGPFPPPQTGVQVKALQRNEETGEMHLRLTPVYGDVIYYDIGAPATTASKKLDGADLNTAELRVSFLCVDSTNAHQTGPAFEWQNWITLKHRFFGAATKQLELLAAPQAVIRYTTDGSDPKLGGAVYDGPFAILASCKVVRAYAEQDGILSPDETLAVPATIESFKVEPKRPALWKHKHQTSSTKETYELLDRTRKYAAQLVGISVNIVGESSDKDWVDFNTNPEKRLDPAALEAFLGELRKLQTSGQVRLDVLGLYFELGQSLLDWVDEVKTEIKPEEVKQ